ncbi:MAG: MBL fold metallo-hydrolase [Chloroflexi bacterium]|nr:MAG: MBL fold metallo-hydrolase [Chloroflexota bacterium]
MGEPGGLARACLRRGAAGEPVAHRPRPRTRHHARRPLVIELVIFRTGGVEIGRSSFVPGASDAKSFAPVWSALLRTPEGNILFDTGLHPVHVDRPDATFGPGSLKVVMAKEDAIVARLLSLGVHPDEIAVVVNSHLHFDHAGGNTVREGEDRVRPAFPNGHQSLVVELRETGRVVLCGDAAFTRENLERGEIRAPDEQTAKESLALIRSLVKDDLERVFVSHDAASWSRWKRAPESYR